MDKEGEESEKNSPNSEKTVVVSPSMRGLTNEQLMQIADDPRAFNEFYKNAGQTGGATAAPSTSSKTSKTSSNSNNVLSPPSRLTVVSPEVHMREQEAQTAIHLRQYLQGAAKGQDFRDQYRLATQTLQEQEKLKRVKTVENIEMLASNLQRQDIDESNDFDIPPEKVVETLAIAEAQVVETNPVKKYLYPWHKPNPRNQPDVDIGVECFTLLNDTSYTYNPACPRRHVHGLRQRRQFETTEEDNLASGNHQTSGDGSRRFYWILVRILRFLCCCLVS